MVGGKSPWKKYLFPVISLLIALTIRPGVSLAVAPLDLAQDVVSTTAPSYLASHDISFTLPVTAQQITPADWIVITLPNFGIVTGPDGISGGYGTGTFSLSGQIAKVTNISLLPGTGIHIIGITANNPQVFQSNEIIMQVCDDTNCNSIRNQSTILTTPGGYITDVSATVQSPLAGVDLSGFTSPGSFVTLTEGGSVIGTTVSTSNGFFSFPLNGINPGAHSYSLNSTDSLGRSSALTTINVFLIAGNVTTVSNILLSPALQLDKTTISPGDTITVSGSAEPNLQINIVVQSPARSYTTTADGSGNWSFTIAGSETTNYSPGQYQVYTIAQDGVGNQSPVSPTVNFTVSIPDNNNPPPNCDISQGDLNCDGKTNLTDFSILLYYWGTNQQRGDINKDGTVNLTDFSIMMFYFQAS